MLKELLLSGLLFFPILFIPSNADIIELKPVIYLDKNFTKNNKLSYSDGIFKIGMIEIKPSASISGITFDIKNLNNLIVLDDNKYSWHFGFNLYSIPIKNINYIAFDLKGMKRLDDISFTDGKIRIIFDDLIDKGELSIINDSRIILYNPTSLSIDPTIELLPNSTNKGYVSPSSLTPKTPSFATSEITQSNYASINVSDTSRYDMFTSSGNSFRYKYNRYVFNLSAIDISSINWLQYCIQGYWYNNVGLGDGGEITKYFNITLNDWVFDSKTYLPFSLLPAGETTNCTNFSGNQIADVVNSSTLFQIGVEIGASVDIIQTTTHVLYNFINLTVSYTPPPSGTCTYSGSGDWYININDNCTLSSSNTLTGNMHIYGSNGYLNFSANQYAHGYYFNSTLGTWWYNNYRWLY